jgi:acetylxylan esterase
MANKIVSYCNNGDEFCDSGNSLQVHLSYVQSNGDAATQFLVSKAKGAAIQKRGRKFHA